MSDPLAGLHEMVRVTRPGGTVAACVWDHGGGTGPLSLFWRAVHDVDPDVEDEGELAGSRAGHLADLFQQAGLAEVEPSSVSVTLEFATFDEWWEPFALGVGPAGAYVAGLDDAGRAEVRRGRPAPTPRRTLHDHRLRLGRPRQGLTRPKLSKSRCRPARSSGGSALISRELRAGQSKTRRRRSAFQRDSAYSSVTSEWTVIPPPVPSR